MVLVYGDIGLNDSLHNFEESQLSGQDNADFKGVSWLFGKIFHVKPCFL